MQKACSVHPKGIETKAVFYMNFVMKNMITSIMTLDSAATATKGKHSMRGKRITIERGLYFLRVAPEDILSNQTTANGTQSI